MAVSALLAVTACGPGPLAKKEDGAPGQPLSPPAEAAAAEAPPMRAEATPGDAAEAASVAAPARRPVQAGSNALRHPVIADLPLRIAQPPAMQLALSVVATGHRLPIDSVGRVALGRSENEKEEFHGYLFLCCCGAAVVAMWLIARRQRGRPVRDRRVPVVWTATNMAKMHWEYVPGTFDSDAFLSRWETIELCVHGDLDLLDAIAGRMAPHEAVDGETPAVEQMPLEAMPSPAVCVEIAEDGVTPAAEAAAVAAGSGAATAIGSEERPRIMADESQDRAASLYQDFSDADLIARAHAWIGEMSRRGLSDPDAARLLVQSLMARAGLRTAREAAALQEAAATFAGWTANLAPMALRPAWRARWLDIQVSRLCMQKGASRLLGFRSLDADCAADGSSEVMHARVRLLLRWSEGLIGAAAKAKRAQADALAARLQPMPGQQRQMPAPADRPSTC